MTLYQVFELLVIVGVVAFSLRSRLKKRAPATAAASCNQGCAACGACGTTQQKAA